MKCIAAFSTRPEGETSNANTSIPKQSAKAFTIKYLLITNALEDESNVGVEAKEADRCTVSSGCSKRFPSVCWSECHLFVL